jgi:bifunctional oligoribonuclease and PAP phosphatase NrnA
MAKDLEQIADQLFACRTGPGSVHLYPHVGIDGDALGSCLALVVILRKIGVQARLLLDEPVPDRLAFMPALDLIEPFDERALPELAAGQQLAVAVDCSDSARLGARQRLFDQAPRIIVIDHHVTSQTPAAENELRCIDPGAAAVGEIIFDLIRLLEKRQGSSLLDQLAATLLMTAIIADTGGFVFSNTSARTFKTAACLMSFSLNLRQITYHLFDASSQARLRLMGSLFSSARFSNRGRLAIALAGRQLLAETGATDADLEGVVSYLRNVDGVEVAFLVRELNDGSLRVNIRSGEFFNAATFAARFGGGGHPKSAGLSLSGMTLDQAADLLSEKAGDLL